MFSFFNELATATGLPFDQINGGFKVVNFNNQAVYIEGIKSILKFTPQQINLKLKKGAVEVFGNNLAIKKLTTNSITILGQITGVQTL